jgi:hypothetical protein
MTTENKKQPNMHTEEDVDQIDELSKGTLRSYINKAGGQMLGAAVKAMDGHKFTDSQKAKLQKRADTVDKAVDKFKAKKEEVELEDMNLSTVSEDVDALFAGEELSEEFKTHAKAIFEAAVQSKVNEQTTELEEQFAAQLDEQAEEFAQNLVTKVDEYLEYVVAEWMEENKLAVERGIKSEMVEDFMTGLKNLFTEHYVDLPEEKVDIVEELASKVASLEETLDKSIATQSELTRELNEHKKAKIAAEISEGLSEIQCEKLKSLAENIDFVSEEDYKDKLALTKQKYFSTKQEEITESKQNSMIDTDGETLEESFSPSMNRYMQSISRIVKK